MVFFDVIQDCHNQQCHGQYDHEFLICTHKHTPFLKTRNGCVAALPAALVSILYCHGAEKPKMTWAGARLCWIPPRAVFSPAPGRTRVFSSLLAGWFGKGYFSLRYSGTLVSSSTCSMAFSWPASFNSSRKEFILSKK